MGYEFYPEALEHTVRYASKEAGVPVIVTENGIGTENDARRVEYIQRSLAGLKRCLDDGIDVRGYIHWSLLDNFEWIFGYGPKFGLVAVDHETQKRTLKPSATLLAKDCEEQFAVKAFTSPKYYKADSKLVPSGLLGPVQIMIVRGDATPVISGRDATLDKRSLGTSKLKIDCVAAENLDASHRFARFR